MVDARGAARPRRGALGRRRRGARRPRTRRAFRSRPEATSPLPEPRRAPRPRTRAWYVAVRAAQRVARPVVGRTARAGSSGSARTCASAAAPTTNASAIARRRRRRRARRSTPSSCPCSIAARAAQRVGVEQRGRERARRRRRAGPTTTCTARRRSPTPRPAPRRAAGCRAGSTRPRAARPCRSRRIASRSAARSRGRARRRRDDAEQPLAVPRRELGREAPVLRAAGGRRTRPGQLVRRRRPRSQLAPLDHPAQRDPGRALGHAEQRAPLHEPAAAHAGAAACRAAGSRSATGATAAGRAARLRSPDLTFLRHLSEKCNMARVTAATMIPEPERPRPSSTRPTASPPNAPPDPAVARRAPPHPERAQRVRRGPALRADDRRSSSPRSGSTTGSSGSPAFVLMGRAHAQFAALMHEAAHRLLFRNRRVNDLVGRWLLGFPSFTPIDLYRRGHMAHHRDEFGPDEPDIPLYRGYPIARASMRRKLVRDATGQHRLEALQGPARAACAPTNPAVRFQARAHRRHAARAHRDRRRARPPVGLLHPLARAVPHRLARHQPAALDRRARRHAAVEGPPPHDALGAPVVRSPASSSCRSTSAGTSRTTSTRASRWRTSRSCTPSSRRAGYVTDALEYPQLPRALAQARRAVH